MDQPPAAGHAVELDSANFMQVVVEGSMERPVLLDLWADWCGPCKALAPVLEKLAEEYAGALVLATLDTEAHAAIAGQLGVRSLPTVQLWSGGRPVDQFTGALPEAEVRRFLEHHLGPATGPAAEESVDDPTAAGLERAAALHAAGRADEAVALLLELQSADPENAEVLLALGQTAVGAGELETAEACLKALPEAAREGVQGRRLSGLLALAREAAEDDVGSDLAALRARHEAAPEDPEARYRYALGAALAGELETGLEQLLALVASSPDYRDGAPRAKLLALFDVLGDDPLAGRYRRRLFALLH